MITTLLTDEVSGDLTLEAKSLLQDSDESGSHAVYVLLTDTKSWFQTIAKRVTKQPYNHVSIAFDDKFNEIYSYSIFSPENGLRGGFMRESRKDLVGSTYSLYKMYVDHDIYQRMRSGIHRLVTNSSKTEYSLKTLVNATFQKEIFEDEEQDKMICSQFVASVFENVGINLFKNSRRRTIRPYDLVKSKLLKFEKRGVIK